MKTQQVTAGAVQSSVPLDGRRANVVVGAHTFNLYAKQVYKDPVLAVVRELVTNGCDSHVRAGKPETPLRVTLPTEVEPVFRVRDYGTGIDDPQKVYTHFFDFGNSDKRQSDHETGAMGIGAKSPYAVAQQFFITCYDGKHKHVYQGYKDEEDWPCCRGPITTPCDEPRGLEVAVPVTGILKNWKDAVESVIANLAHKNSPYCALHAEVITDETPEGEFDEWLTWRGIGSMCQVEGRRLWRYNDPQHSVTLGMVRTDIQVRIIEIETPRLRIYSKTGDLKAGYSSGSGTSRLYLGNIAYGLDYATAGDLGVKPKSAECLEFLLPGCQPDGEPHPLMWTVSREKLVKSSQSLDYLQTIYEEELKPLPQVLLSTLLECVDQGYNYPALLATGEYYDKLLDHWVPGYLRGTLMQKGTELWEAIYRRWDPEGIDILEKSMRVLRYTTASRGNRTTCYDRLRTNAAVPMKHNNAGYFNRNVLYAIVTPNVKHQRFAANKVIGRPYGFDTVCVIVAPAEQHAAIASAIEIMLEQPGIARIERHTEDPYHVKALPKSRKKRSAELDLTGIHSANLTGLNALTADKLETGDLPLQVENLFKDRAKGDPAAVKIPLVYFVAYGHDVFWRYQDGKPAGYVGQHRTPAMLLKAWSQYVHRVCTEVGQLPHCCVVRPAGKNKLHLFDGSLIDAVHALIQQKSEEIYKTLVMDKFRTFASTRDGRIDELGHPLANLRLPVDELSTGSVIARGLKQLDDWFSKIGGIDYWIEYSDLRNLFSLFYNAIDRLDYGYHCRLRDWMTEAEMEAKRLNAWCNDTLLPRIRECYPLLQHCRLNQSETILVAATEYVRLRDAQHPEQLLERHGESIQYMPIPQMPSPDNPKHWPHLAKAK